MNLLGNAAFDPETISLLRTLLDEVWAVLRPEQQALINKDTIAKAILYLAAQGERDPIRLRADASFAVMVFLSVKTELASTRWADL